MSLSFARCLALAGFTVFAITAPASAQPRQAAPITYAAGAVQTASLEPRLTGGGEESYGYGPTASASGPPVDLRRATSTRAEEGAAPWLERERVGPPYEVNGRWYAPAPEPGYEMEGQASWYGPTFHGQATASGEIFDQEGLSAAHPTLPIPSLVQVTNLENGREIIVRVNDRGPFVGDRLIDLSHGAATVLGFEQAGQARVHVRYLGPAPRHVAISGAARSTARPAAASVASPRSIPAVATNDGPTSLLPPGSAATPTPVSAPVYVGAPVSATQPVSYTPPRAAAETYFVQVGAYSDLMNAHRVKAAIESAGPVVVEAVERRGGEIFRVRVGPLRSLADAEAARRALTGLGYGESIIAPR
jgi:rare lipoprotein A